MFKWIITILFALASIPTLAFALDDQGSTAADWIKNIVIALTILLGIIAAIIWFSDFRKRRKIISLSFLSLPILVCLCYVVLYALTQQKINKPYFLLATDPEDYSHQYQYYFRTDSTMKTHGIYFLGDGNYFQNFRMKGDTIFLDTILETTGIQAKLYLKRPTVGLNGQAIKILVPLDSHGKVIDSLTKLVIEEEKR